MDKEQILYQGRQSDWIFGFKYKDCEKGAIFTLMKLADIPIRRHVKMRNVKPIHTARQDATS